MIENLWMMSIESCVLILIVLLMRAALQRYPKIYSYGLWALVLLRLLCPVFVESSLSLQPDLNNSGFMQRVRQEQENALGENTDATGSGAWNAALSDKLQTQDSAGQMNNGDTTAARNPAAPSKTEPADRSEILTGAVLARWIPVVRIAYLAGIAVVSGMFLFQYIRMRLRVATAVREKKNVYLCEHIQSPFVMGVIRSKIYLPYHVPENEKRYILKHERVHIRHRDPLIRMLGIIACCLHWWNPLVWYGVHKMNQDMEMFCDETAMAHAPLAERKAYSETLLRFSMRQSGLAVALSFGESNTEKRVKNVLKKKRKSVLVLTALLVIAAGCTVAFLSVPAAKARTNDDQTPPKSGSESGDEEEHGGTEEPSGSQSAMDQYRAVLLGNADFYAVDAGQNLRIDQLGEAVGNTSAAEAKRLSVLDLNNDGTPEVIVQADSDQGDSVAFLVLLWRGDGTVSGYTFWPRSFEALKTDGSFSFSSGAADHGYGTVIFTEDAYIINRESYSESSYDSDNNLEVVYYVNSEQTDESEFLDAIRWQDEKADVSWYDFTEETIRTLEACETVRTRPVQYVRLGSSNSSNRLDYYGHWEVTALAGTAGVSALSQEEIDSCIGTVIGYGSDAYTCKMPTADEPYTSRLAVSGYEEGSDSGADFQEKWRTTPDALGLTADPVACVTVGVNEPDAFGAFFYIKDADTIVAYYMGAFFEASRIDHEAVDNQTDEAYYEMTTSFSKTEVESFAREVREQLLNRDWESLSEKIAYPITIAGTTYQNAQELLSGNPDAAVTEDFMDKIRAETCENMFFNWQGICMGETGQVWIAEVLSDSYESEGLKIIGINV